MSPADHAHASWRRADIQGLRAIAILLVVAFHAGLPIPGGFIGVDVFFVISGFVIAQLFLRQQASPRGFRLRSFYRRRMQRLLPAMALMVTITLLIAIVLESPFGPQRTTAITGLGATFFVANFVIYATTGGYFDAPAEANPLLHTWSLSVEEQFYFVFPALMIAAAAWGMRRGTTARRPALMIMSLVAALSFVAALGLGFAWWDLRGIAQPASWAFYASPTRAWEFSAGAILALLLIYRTRPLPTWLAQILGLTGMGLILLGAVTIHETDVFPGLVALIPVAGTMAVIAAGTGPARNASTTERSAASVINRFLSIGLMVWIGALSYSWYLWHWPIIVFTGQVNPGNSAALLVAAAASLLPAWLSYKYVENPIRLNTRIRGRRALIVIALAMGIPTLVAIVVIAGAQRGWWNSTIQYMSAQVQPVPISFTSGCDNGVPLGQQQDLSCTWNANQKGTPVYLVGDSQAGQFAEATITAGGSVGRPVTIATSGSCPFITRADSEASIQSPECEAFVAQTVTWLEGQPPATVLIGMSGNYVTPEYAATVQERMTRTVETLQQAGHTVQIFQPIPQFLGWSPTTCSMWQAITDSLGCGAAVPRMEMDSRQVLELEVFESVSAETKAPLILTRDHLCTPESCATNEGNTWRYRDMFHISVRESERFAPVLIPYLAQD